MKRSLRIFQLIRFSAMLKDGFSALQRHPRHEKIIGMLLILVLLAGCDFGAAISRYTIASTGICSVHFGGAQNGQSFTVSGQSGEITSIAFASDQNDSGNLQIYEGAGFAGRLLHTQKIAYTHSGTALQTFDLSRPVPVQSGNVYTFRIGDITGNNVGLCGSSTNPYPDGAFIDASGTSVAVGDLDFIVAIEF